MQSAISTAVLAGLGGMLGWGFGDFFAKKTIDAIGDIPSLVWGHFIGAFAFILIGLCIRGTSLFTIEHGVRTWLILVFFGVLQGIVYILLFRGFSKGQVAVLNPLFSSFTGVVAIVSILFFGEVIVGHTILALAIIFAGIMTMSLDLSQIHLKKIGFTKVAGLPEVALATLCAAFWTIGWDRFVKGHDWLAYAVFMYLFMTVFIYLFARHKGTSLKISKPGIWKYVGLIGLCEVFAYYAISYGYSTNIHTSIIALISGAFSLPTIILARTFLGERTSKAQLWGSLAIVLGIILLSLL